MYIDFNIPVTNIMTNPFTYVRPDNLMSEVAEIMDTTPIHHLPVLDENNRPLGIISKMDYYQLQNHFTRLGFKDYVEKNNRFMKSLTAEEVMTKNPSCIHHKSNIGTAIQVFLENLFHALPVVKDEKCIGILTSYDILKFINESRLSLT